MLLRTLMQPAEVAERGLERLRVRDVSEPVVIRPDARLGGKINHGLNHELSADSGPLLQIFGVPPGRDEPSSAHRDQTGV
jgi:hypothetical protein